MSSNTVSDTMKTVSIARNIKRPTAREFIDQLFDEFMEFHGIVIMLMMERSLEALHLFGENRLR